MEEEMTPLQKEYIQYVRKIAYIDGLLQSMLSHLSENDKDGIKGCIEDLYKVDPDQANKFKIILTKNESV